MSTHSKTASFSKYEACGNDFLFFDHRVATPICDWGSVAASLCHRQKGIGADGLVLFEESKTTDCKMRIFNKDGSPAEMCGNALRCLYRFAQELGHAVKELSVETPKRMLKVGSIGEEVWATLGPAENITWDIPVVIEQTPLTLHYLDTGVPHVVVFVNDLESAPLKVWGPLLRYHPLFAPQGTNVDLVSIEGPQALQIRTYERGVEGETLACGTGAAAAALAAVRCLGMPSPLKVRTRSGEIISIAITSGEKEGLEITTIGPARRIFQGVVELTGWG